MQLSYTAGGSETFAFVRRRAVVARHARMDRVSRNLPDDSCDAGFGGVGELDVGSSNAGPPQRSVRVAAGESPGDVLEGLLQVHGEALGAVAANEGPRARDVRRD